MKFGKTVRRLREARNLSIAEFARKVGMSPTYLAPIERDVFPAPAEAKVVRIARALGQDPDEFLALAGRIASDLERMIRKRPKEMAALLRAADRLSAQKVQKLADSIGRRGRKPAKRKPRRGRKR
jgi:transcriptional regulator with XRE-family HTH domain